MGQAAARGLTARPHSEQTSETRSGYPQATQRPDLTRSHATATLKIAPRVKNKPRTKSRRFTKPVYRQPCSGKPNSPPARCRICCAKWDLELGILARLPLVRTCSGLRADGTVSAFRSARRRRVLRLAQGCRARSSTPASCRLLLWRSGWWSGWLLRPSGPCGLRSIGGILPPTPCARWGNREPGVLARLPPRRTRSRPRADVTGFAAEDGASTRHPRRRAAVNNEWVV